MRHRLIPAALGSALVVIAFAACGGSNKAAGTNAQSYTAGTGTVGTSPLPSSGTGAGASGSTAATGATTGGSSGGSFGDATKGKALFIAKCGACHTLKAAGTNGQVGPDLDSSAKAKDPQMVFDQITKNAVAPMPLGLYAGQDAKDVAAYVASVAGK